MRHAPIEPPARLMELLDEAGVQDYPRDGPDEASLQGLLTLALHVAERQKGIDFSGFSWEDPRFVSRDAKVDITLLYTKLAGRTPDDVAAAFRDALARPRTPFTMLALDTRESGITEFEIVHHLYGEVTLFRFPHKPLQSADLRIEQARDKGWTPTLKEHNLLPGRGIVVLDEHHGLVLNDESLQAFVGALALLPTGHVTQLLNPFVHEEANESELQHWLAWGPGTKASEWRVMLDVREDG